MITNIRMLSQQLANPQFEHPRDLVQWMGAMQAQNYSMAKWAIGIRLKQGNIRQVDDALKQGTILRTHIMRPTWHFVAAEDIRWMIDLTGKRINSAFTSYTGRTGLTERKYAQCIDELQRLLEGHNHLTKQEIGEGLQAAGLHDDVGQAHFFTNCAEALGIVCSGIDKGDKPTFALLEERVPPTKPLHKEEALALLATRYFSSHSPASLQDFIWWSGLTTTDCRLAIKLIETDLIKDRFGGEELLVHQSWKDRKDAGPIVHLLPSFDEYLLFSPMGHPTFF